MTVCSAGKDEAGDWKAAGGKRAGGGARVVLGGNVVWKRAGQKAV